MKEEVCLGRDGSSQAVLWNWSHSILEDDSYMSTWAASIAGLDLAWDVGTLTSQATFCSSASSSLRPKRSRTEHVRRVRFQVDPEFYVGNESSVGPALCAEKFSQSQIKKDSFTSLAKTSQPANPIVSHDPRTVHEEGDTLSLLAAGGQAGIGGLWQQQNRGAPAVADVPAIAHQDGEDVEIEVEAEIQEDESSSSDSDSSEQRRAVLVYSIDMNPMHCRPRWGSYEKLHHDIAHHLRLSSHDLTIVHSVETAPDDLRLARVHPFIAQKPQDITEGSTFQLILLDVAFHNALPSLEPETVRRVKVMPQTVSRKALLALLGLHKYCQYTRNLCLVRHNTQLIGVQQKALINLRHGDYVKVDVPPARGVLRQHYTREVAQCMRRGYMPSNIPTVLENYPAGFDVVDMPVIDTFNFLPRVEDLDYDRDAMNLLQLAGPSRPSFDPWPSFLTRPGARTPTECKVPEHEHVEVTPVEVALHPQQEEGRPEIPFGEIDQVIHDLQQLWETFAATEQEEEGRVLYLNTWYTDHVRYRHCQQPRPIRLLAPPWNWPDQIAEAWDDWVDPDAILDIYLVRPHPRVGSRGAAERVPHVIIVQHAAAGFSSVHITVVDTLESGNLPRENVMVVPAALNKDIFYDLLGIGHERMVTSLIDCMVYHGELEVAHDTLFPAQHGFSFIVVLNHLRDIITRAAASRSSASSSHLNLLQKDVKRQTILLDELTAPQGSDRAVIDKEAVRIVWGQAAAPHPQYIEVPRDAAVEQLKEELTSWGVHGQIVDCRERNCAVCLPHAAELSDGWHYVFVNLDLNDPGELFLHTAQKPLTMQEVMAHLHGLGYWRAVLHHQVVVYEQVFKISFKDQIVQMQQRPKKQKGDAVWPAPQSVRQWIGPFFHECKAFHSQHLIDIGIATDDIHELFQSHDDLLQTSFEGVQLPAELQSAIDACNPELPMEEIDRLLIYTDGSSMGDAKHLPPLRAEEEGKGDTWAMLILGERYDPPGLRIVGWSAQQVHYDTCSAMHLGATRIGADVAEQEGLSWAALWRLSRNWNVPTCFRSDSKTALGQAEGVIGTTNVTENFVFLRGAHQAVVSALGQSHVLYAHVPGHAGEAWNEICDWLAKEERKKSFYCKRPRLDMRKWRKAMRHFWMVVGAHEDLPLFCGHGLHAPAPQLPDRHSTQHGQALSTQKSVWATMHFQLSACSANVNSLCSTPQGHEGKVAYLRQQIKELGINFFGVQESRAQEICSCVDDVYRLASGCMNHQQGVELWINLSQPYGYLKGRPQYFEKGDFQVAYKDARILMVRINTKFWNAWIVVAYAPHSGLSWKERERWWHQLSEITHKRQATTPLIVMVDANASPGAADGKAVHCPGLHSSSSTPLMRSYVEEHGLVLPNTTAVHLGDLSTWIDPAGHHEYCIDYVMISEDLAAACTLSRVVPELDLGHGSWDHTATAVDLRWEEGI